jgi:hypothetical protein
MGGDLSTGLLEAEPPLEPNQRHVLKWEKADREWPPLQAFRLIDSLIILWDPLKLVGSPASRVMAFQ